MESDGGHRNAHLRVRYFSKILIFELERLTADSHIAEKLTSFQNLLRYHSSKSLIKTNNATKCLDFSHLGMSYFSEMGANHEVGTPRIS
jgi:hypothetical protein